MQRAVGFSSSLFSLAPFWFTKAFMLLGFLILSACGQNISEINIQAINPQDPDDSFVPAQYISTVDLEGGTTQSATSAQSVLSIQKFGGATLRTKSSSPSFRMTSGIGVD